MGEAYASSFGIVLHLLVFAFSVQHAWRWSVFVVVLVDGPWKHMGLVAARTPAQPSRMTPALAGRKRLRGSVCIQLWHRFASSRVCVQCTACWRWSVFVVVLVDGPWKHVGLVAARTPAQPCPLEAHEAEAGCCIASTK